ncbi:MAG: heparan-alpha-glucosaminide N-acetyltransferase domain-containing protein [Myxococcota bacterium]|nr:heparan-alpha-glucosaminide N-acetyltransferase domain-containing protein [Myxococcota bacterium]
MRTANRIDYIDHLRGLAVIAMFFVHAAGAWLHPSVHNGVYWHWAMRISGLVAPVFMFLAGISVSIVACNSGTSKENIRDTRRKLAIRGVKLIALGYAMHAVFWIFRGMDSTWPRVFKVDILHCIGLSFAILPALAWPRRILNWPALAAFFAIPLIGQVFFRLPIVQWMPSGLAAYLTTNSKLALFPFIPYATWMAMGLFVGPIWVAANRVPSFEPKFWRFCALSAVVTYGVGMGMEWVYYHHDLHLVGGSDIPTRGLPHVFLQKAALVLVLFVGFRFLNLNVTSQVMNPLRRFGQASLFAYCAHLMIVYHIGGSHLTRAMWPAQHIAACAVLTVCMYGLTVAWQQWPALTVLRRSYLKKLQKNLKPLDYLVSLLLPRIGAGARGRGFRGRQ